MQFTPKIMVQAAQEASLGKTLPSVAVSFTFNCPTTFYFLYMQTCYFKKQYFVEGRHQWAKTSSGVDGEVVYMFRVLLCQDRRYSVEYVFQ